MLNHFFQKIKCFFCQKDYWLCFLAGFSLVFAYAPFSFWPLTLFVPIIFLHTLSQCNKNGIDVRKSTKLGFIFALGWFASGISWVHVSIDQFGGLPLIFSLLLMLFLCLYLALFSALACYLTAKFSSKLSVNNSTKNQFNLWLLVPFWLIAEYLRSVVLTGFPWLSLGYSQINSPLASFAPVIGEVGLTAVIWLINISLYKLLRKEQTNISASLLIITAVLTLTFQQTQWVTTTGEITKVALVQGNVAQSMKWQPDQEWPTMLKYLDLTRKNYAADIIIWPESAIPVIEPSAQDYLSTVNKSALLNESAIITGILNYNFESRAYFNSLIVLGKKDNEDEKGYYYNNHNRFYKHHLLPIGEFVPFQEWLRPLAPFFNLPNSSFTRGDYIQPNLVANNISLLPLICFEIAFPEQLAANLTSETNMILTVSNDAWFGNSHGPHQHLDIARMRALEFGRPVLRATNNGITATIDHLGEVTARIPQFEEAVLTSDIALVSGNTPYSQWPRLILWLLIISLFVLSYKLRNRN